MAAEEARPEVERSLSIATIQRSLSQIALFLAIKPKLVPVVRVDRLHLVLEVQAAAVLEASAVALAGLEELVSWAVVVVAAAIPAVELEALAAIRHLQAEIIRLSVAVVVAEVRAAHMHPQGEARGSGLIMKGDKEALPSTLTLQEIILVGPGVVAPI